MASEYLKYLNRDIRPEDPPPELSPKEKLKNWWYYHWKVTVITAIIIIAVITMILKNLGITEPLPDYSIAYVGSHYLSDETVDIIVSLFETYGTDETGDSKITVEINQYVMYDDPEDYDSVQLTSSASAALDADITMQTSYFFLLENPDVFSASYQLLADEDGNLPADDDFDWNSKVFLLSDITDSLPSEDSTLYLGRRGFYDDEHTVKYRDACDRLWSELKNLSE